ncbi:hypothetical protein ACFYWY_37670 [Streptomyces sp. NPDC002870]|uniref:hypothetical protein n=1 Tax=Streptomyces sp. NPDC002870 TaxID=3364666 RepID=UPI0036AB1AB2
MPYENAPAREGSGGLANPPSPQHVRRCAGALLLLMLGVLAGLVVAVPMAAHATPALLQIYPVSSVHQALPDNRLTVNGKRMSVMDFPGYDIAQSATGTGTGDDALIGTAALVLHDVSKGAHVRAPQDVVNDWMPAAGNEVPWC